MSEIPTLETFLKDVSEHKLTVIKDDGLYRHIRLSRPGSSCMRFDIITWPGSICYTGDMGSYVFSRVQDMFGFFRRSKLSIKNPSYWREKLDAVDCDGIRKSGAAKIFSFEKFKKAIEEYLDDSDVSPELRQEVIDKVIFGDEDGTRCYDRAYEFRSALDPKFEFHDLFEWDFYEFEYRFIWCCYALVFAISEYDKHLEMHKTCERNANA